MTIKRTSPTRDALCLALSHALDRASKYQFRRDIECAKRLNEMINQSGEFDYDAPETTLCDHIDTIIDG